MKISRILALTALFVASFLAMSIEAEVYKWVDENGVTHYSERPPEGKPSSEMELTQPMSAEQVEQGESIYLETINQRKVRREAMEAQKKQESIKRKNLQSKTRHECARAERENKTLKIACPVFYDGEGVLRYSCPRQSTIAYKGEFRYIGDEERASKIKHNEKLLAKCRQIE